MSVLRGWTSQAISQLEQLLLTNALAWAAQMHTFWCSGNGWVHPSYCSGNSCVGENHPCQELRLLPSAMELPGSAKMALFCPSQWGFFLTRQSQYNYCHRSTNSIQEPTHTKQKCCHLQQLDFGLFSQSSLLAQIFHSGCAALPASSSVLTAREEMREQFRKGVAVLSVRSWLLK